MTATSACRCGGTGEEWDLDHKWDSYLVGPCLECEVRALREVVQVVARVLGDPLHFTDERLARAVQRALDSGSDREARS